MKLFNPGGERGSAMSYAALLEKIEIMRSTLRWATRLERPTWINCCARRTPCAMK